MIENLGTYEYRLKLQEELTEVNFAIAGLSITLDTLKAQKEEITNALIRLGQYDR